MSLSLNLDLGMKLNQFNPLTTYIWFRADSDILSMYIALM